MKQISDDSTCASLISDCHYAQLRYETEETGTVRGKSKQDWLVTSLMGLVGYTVSNYVAGTQKGDIYAAKVANSLCLGLIAIGYFAYKIRKYGFDLAMIIGFKYQTKLSETLLNSDLEILEIRCQNTTGVMLQAIFLSLIGGLLNALGITCLYVAFDDAAKHGYNLSICSAILSSNCMFALIASFTVFKDKITIFQTLGVFINFGGVLIIFFGQSQDEITYTMIGGSAMCSTLLGLKVILSRYCFSRIDCTAFINLNFIADFIFALGWIIIYMIGWFEFQINLKEQTIVFFGGVFSAGAELFLFIAIEKGIAGAVVSIANTNGIGVGILNWAIQGAALSILQIVAIGLTFIGILTMSLGEIILNKFRSAAS